MDKLFPFLANITEFNSMVDSLKSGVDQQVAYGLSGSQKSFILSAMSGQLDRPILLITHNEEHAQEVYTELKALLMDREIVYFPVLEWIPFEVLGRSKEIEAARLAVLAKLQQGIPVSVVTTIQAVERLFIPCECWTALRLKLIVGECYDLQRVYRQLQDMGYERVASLEGPGQFSVRGGILDVYSVADNPIRLEFFDDELDSIRVFNPQTQRSTEQLNKVVIYPARELVVPYDEMVNLRQKVHAHGEKVKQRLKKLSPGAVELLEEHLAQLEEKFALNVWEDSFEQFVGLAYKGLDSFLSYIPTEAIIVLDEALRVRDYLDFAVRERAEEYTSLLQAGKAFVDPNESFLDYAGLIKELNDHQTIFLASLPRQIPLTKPHNLVTFVTKPIEGFAGRFGALAEEVNGRLANGYGVALLVQGQEHALRLKDYLWEYGINAPLLASDLKPGQVGILPLGIREGFEFPLAKLAVIGEGGISRRETRKRVKPQKVKGAKINAFIDLKPGDFVVHVNHGIGKFVGIEKLDVGGVARDYFLVKYAGEDKLYVPFDQTNLLQKYLGGEGQLPKLYRLGGNDWVKVKGKVKASVKEMAFDLLKLYAERNEAKGYAFSSDNVWQKEFEERFPYEETEDQLRCIEEVKEDMLNQRPMDRVVCGDVGYGKTEVAIRAAFKAVMDSKQVAVLVPTTILAQQHFVTFSERFAGYPIKIEMLSRFRTPKEQKQVSEALKNGAADIVIGTHRLVSEDVKFKDLGLLIVDEEQRFGVSHKEKLKLLKKNVDVLTLSATPIPRTLHMALVNIRDMSVIETPPEDRYPVQTYVAEYSLEMVREAIRRELNRGGQVFYVHNRVQDLDKITSDLTKLVPESRIVYAHGQMREDELEQVMLDFMEKRFDLLVCTTIIETGLDLPNVNTLIVNDADKMGLSQLYQLRGRVGRSNRKAYAYFLYRKDKILSETSEKRLSAIRDFTEFGSGFKIAMRDLELRGAGNLLGAEQHGQVAAVGFDLYCQLLEQAVAELKGNVEEEVIEPAIELEIDAYFDSGYIGDSSVKTDFYKRLMNTRTIQDLEDITEELIDRFGDPPVAVSNLLDIVRLRIKAMYLGISGISQEKGYMVLKFGKDPGLSGEQLMNLARKVGPSLSFSATNGLEMRLHLNPKIGKIPLKSGGELLDIIIKIADKQPPLV